VNLNSERVDALVVGAGPAGSVLATLLAREGWRVLIVDAGQGPARRAGETLAGAARVPLEELGLWRAVLQQNPEPAFLVRSIWSTDEAVDRDSLRDRYGPAYHIDRERFDRCLLEAAIEAGCSVRHGTRVVALDREPYFRVQLAQRGNRSELVARYLVDATGRSASVSRKLGAMRREIDDLVGIARWYRKREPFTATLVEAVPEGWWYSAPVPGEGLVACLMTDACTPAAHASDAEVWARCLQSGNATAARIRGAIAHGPARVSRAFPAVTDWDPQQGFVPVGDAAAAFDPLSGDGLCFALQSAKAGALALRETKAGNAVAIAEYRQVVQRIFREHLARRAEHYAAVKRFGGAPFWTRFRGERGVAASVARASSEAPAAFVLERSSQAALLLDQRAVRLGHARIG